MFRIKGEKMRRISLNSCRNESIVSQSFCHAFPVSSPSVKFIIQLGSRTKRMESCDVCNDMLCDLVFSIYLNPGVQTQPLTDRSEYIKWLSVILELCWTCNLFVSQPSQVQIQVFYAVKWTETWSELHGHVRQEVAPEGRSVQGHWWTISLIQGTLSSTENKAIY